MNNEYLEQSLLDELVTLFQKTTAELKQTVPDIETDHKREFLNIIPSCEKFPAVLAYQN